MKTGNDARKKLVEIKRWVILPDGKRTRRSFYGKTEGEAKRKHLEATTPPLAPNGAPEGSFAWYFLAKYVPLKVHLRPKSRESIQNTARHLLPELGDMPMHLVDATVVTVALERIAQKRYCVNPTAREATKRYRQLGPRTVNLCRRLALETVEVASETSDDVRRINPRRVPLREEEPKTIKPYSPQELRTLLEACRGTVCFAPVLLWGFLGLRLRESLALETGDLIGANLEAFFQVDAKGRRVKMKTRYSPRTFPLPPGLLEEIQALCFGGGRLCKGEHGAPLRADNVDRSLDPKIKRAKLRRLTPHEIRHSFSSWLDENGCPSGVRLRLMGQSTRAVKDRYNHPTPEALSLWLGKLWEASLPTDPEQASTSDVVKVRQATSGR